MSARFRKKPVVIEAKQLTFSTLTDLLDWIGDDVESWCWDAPVLPHAERYIEIRTLEGKVKAQDGDWVVKGVKGEFYPVKPDIFALTHEDASTAAEEPVAVAEVISDFEFGDHGAESRVRWLLNPMPAGAFLYEEAADARQVPDEIAEIEGILLGNSDAYKHAYKNGWNECRAAMLAAAPKPTARELERLFDPARLPPPDTMGFFEHPDVPDGAETQDQIIVRLASLGWDAQYEELDDCYRDEHADDYDPAKIREWAPDTQGGWQLVSKYECEDGVFALLVRPSNAEGLRDALDHIRRVARGSRTGTRRLEWIAERAHSALEGNTEWRDLPAPKMDTRNIEFRRGQRVRVTSGDGVIDPGVGAEFVVDHVQPPVPARQGRVWIKSGGGGSGFALNFDQIEIVREAPSV